jgi:mRNA interferase RelE/StbE
MKVAFEASFARDLKRIEDKALYRRVEETISEVKSAAALSEIRHLRKMRGYATYYRIRLGDYRIVSRWSKTKLFLSGYCTAKISIGTFRKGS